MKLSFTNALSVLSVTVAAIAAEAESNDASTIDLLVKKVDELTAKIEALEQQQLFSQKEDRRFLQSKSAKSSKATSTPTSQPTTSSAELVACKMSQFQCSDLKTNVLGTQSHQTPDVYLTHTEQCQAFKFLLERANEPAAATDLLKAMHCETVPDVNATEYEMVVITEFPEWYYNVTDPDPYGPQLQACKGFVNVGTCSSQLPYFCSWFADGYVAKSYEIPIGQDVGLICADYCLGDSYCRASYFVNEIGEERTCNIIHVSPSIPDGSRYTCSLFDINDCKGGPGTINRVFVKQEVGSDYCDPN